MVLITHANSSTTLSRTGKLLYHQLGDYDCESAHVIFTFERESMSRYVSAIGEKGDVGDESKKCSWIFSIESIPDQLPSSPANDIESPISQSTTNPLNIAISTDVPSPSKATRGTQQRRVNNTRGTRSIRKVSRLSPCRRYSMGSQATIASPSRSTQQNMPLSNTTSAPRPHSSRYHNRRTSDIPTSHQRLPHSNGDHAPTTPHVGNFPIDKSAPGLTPPLATRAVQLKQFSNPLLIGQSVPTRSQPVYSQVGLPLQGIDAQESNASILSNTFSTGDMSMLHVRISLLERNLNDLMQNSRLHSLNLASTAVLLALKWSLLRKLEVPLSPSRLPSVNKHGVLISTLTVKSNCDSLAFRDISAFLAKKHSVQMTQSTSRNNSSSRILFHPSYQVTQSGSAGVQDQYIVFSTLSDLMDLLGIRDEVDYERILTKELITEKSNVIRIVGSLKVVGNQMNITSDPSSSRSSSNESMSQTTGSVLRLFPGFSPCSLEINGRSKHRSSEEVTTNDSMPRRQSYSSFVFDQQCRHFSNELNCYRTAWKAHGVTSTFHIHQDDIGRRSNSDLGVQDLQNFFVLHWSRMKSPSSSKWTRDTHVTQNACPGDLCLSLPVVYSSSRRNVAGLSELLDRHIENIMDLRTCLKHGTEINGVNDQD